jgi:hypothetical protein
VCVYNALKSSVHLVRINRGPLPTSCSTVLFKAYATPGQPTDKCNMPETGPPTMKVKTKGEGIAVGCYRKYQVYGKSPRNFQCSALYLYLSIDSVLCERLWHLLRCLTIRSHSSGRPHSPCYSMWLYVG